MKRSVVVHVATSLGVAVILAGCRSALPTTDGAINARLAQIQQEQSQQRRALARVERETKKTNRRAASVQRQKTSTAPQAIATSTGSDARTQKQLNQIAAEQARQLALLRQQRSALARVERETKKANRRAASVQRQETQTAPQKTATSTGSHARTQKQLDEIAAEQARQLALLREQRNALARVERETKKANRRAASVQPQETQTAPQETATSTASDARTQKRLDEIAAEQARQLALLQRLLSKRNEDTETTSKLITGSLARPGAESRPSAYGQGPHCTGVRPVMAHTKVFGGKDALISNWPGHVALRLHRADKDKSFYFCGGTLIADRWVLTAAHCVYKPKFKTRQGRHWQRFPAFAEAKTAGFIGDGELQIVHGVDDLRQATSTHVAGVSRIIVHPGYDRPALHRDAVCGQDQCPNVTGHDIALLELDRAVDGPYGRIAMHPRTDPFDDIPVPSMVAGFGRTDWAEGDIGAGLSFDDPVARRSIAASHVLKEADVTTVRQAECRRSHGNVAIGPGQICAFDPQTEAEKDTCQGDSGGPLVVYDNQQCPYIVGLTSWGKGCAAPKAFAVYTRVSYYADWIRKYVTPSHDVAPSTVPDPFLVQLGRKEFDRGLALIETQLGTAKTNLEVQLCTRDSNRGTVCEKSLGLRHGRRFQIAVSPKVAGHLILLNVTPFGFASLLHPPRRLVVGPRLSAGKRAFEPGVWVDVHLVSDGGRLLALVVPDRKDAEEIVASMRAAQNPVEVFQSWVTKTHEASVRAGDAARDWGFASVPLAVRY